MKNDIGGPFLSSALFCERVLQEKDGVLSLIRIIDRLIHNVSGEDAPDKMPSFKIQISILIGFKSGDVRGKRELKIKPNAPSGKILPVVSVPILLEGADKGANVNIGYAFEAQEEGLYWFDVMLNDELFTRMPLSIIYQKTQTTTGTSQPLQ
jgi:hypothetical protein